jgi:hypothetical protein
MKLLLQRWSKHRMGENSSVSLLPVACVNGNCSVEGEMSVL